VCVAALSNRGYIFVTATRRIDDAKLQLDVWRAFANGSVKHLTTAAAGTIDEGVRPTVTISSVGAQSVVTCVRLDGQDLKAILWRYADEKLDRLDSVSLGEPPVGTYAACGVSRETAVAAIQDNDKKLKLVAYGFPEDGRYIEQRGTADAGGIRNVGVCRLGTGMVVTGVRGSGDKLKLILWRVSKGGHSFARWDDLSTEDTFHESFPHLAMCQTGPHQFVTAIRDRDGKLKVSSWRGFALLGFIDQNHPDSQSIAASQDLEATGFAGETEDDCDV
jgi:hypothetical protein